MAYLSLFPIEADARQSDGLSRHDDPWLPAFRKAPKPRCAS
jgi:hypothetical protein